MANEVRIRATVNDQVSGPLAKITDKFDHLGKSKGFQSIVSGVGLGIGAQAWQMASSQIVSVIGDAVEAAKQEEVSIQKLGSALQANVADWDGNTDAIERTLKAQMELGFSDDEQRDSLAKLAAATGDVNKALTIQRTAMDLARFKGISLAEATDALTKVEAGSYRILKSLGIVLKDGATQTEALAAVQKVAAGQAADYADTNTGKLLVSQVKVNEAMEKFGTAVLPLVADATGGVADLVVGLSQSFDILNGKLPTTSEEVRDTEQGFVDLAQTLGLLVPGAKLLGDVMEDNMTKVGDESETMRDRVDWAAGDVVDSTGFMERAMENFEKTVKTDTRNVTEYFSDMREALVDDVDAIIDEAFDPIEARLDEQAGHYEILAGIQERESAKGRAAILAANDDIIRELDNQAETLKDLGKAHKLTAKDVDKYEDDIRASYAAMGKKVPKSIELVLAKLRELAGFDGKNVNVDVYTRWKNTHAKTGTGPTITDGPKHAMGYVGTTKGPTMTGVGWMGEAGTEAYAILRNPKPIKSTGGFGGGEITLNLVSSGVLSPAHGQAIAREVGPYLRDYLNRRG